MTQNRVLLKFYCLRRFFSVLLYRVTNMVSASFMPWHFPQENPGPICTSSAFHNVIGRPSDDVQLNNTDLKFIAC